MTEDSFKATSHQHRMLDGMRGLLAFWVAFAHLTYRQVYDEGAYDAGFASTEYFRWLEPLIAFHFLAVDVFFVLSGCLLYLVYRRLFEQKTTSWGIDRFYLQRLARIYPMFLVGVALIGLFHLLGIPHPLLSGNQDMLFEHWPTTLVLNLMLFQSWGITPGASWNAPTWTVSQMFLVYILFPNIVTALAKLPDTVRSTLIAIAVVYLLYAMARNTIPNLSHSDGVGAILRAFAFFITGCLTARLYRHGYGRNWLWAKLLAVMLGIFIAAMVFWFKVYAFPVALFHLVYPFLMLGLLYGKGGVTHLLTNRVSVFLGSISYSLYILHYPILLLVKYLWGDLFAGWAAATPLALLVLYPLVIAALILPAWFFTRTIELPINRWAKHKLSA